MQGFRLNGSRVLEIDLQNNAVRAATGSMIAYAGDVKFKNAGMGGGDGLKAALKRRATGESVSLMQCTGNGTVWFAKDAMEILLIQLNGETLKVESEQLLALSDKLRTDVAFAGLRGATSGQGLFTTTVTGQGDVALLSAGGPPIALQVSPQFPLVVDPDAFIASQGQLNQTFVTDVSWRNLIGESSGEAFSLRFDGNGVVYIQPEER
ncbi:AIM24 family protein [Pseudonocardia sp. TRM90224]|uniref:AIM24 family protein n=1 Tax=Pseudonocardia sp. TRM90224 TaxID=2812678 RepID=UPI001E30A48A|nr:AIM24 family protein [Pseudonocardia sp. TRM90224]